MRRYILIGCVFTLLVVTGAVLAQSTALEDFNTCDQVGLSAAITDALAATGNDEEALTTTLMEAASAIYRVQATCNELSFEGINAKLLGPIELPEGYYRVRVTTDGFFIAKPEIISGTCDAGGFAMFNLMMGQASDGAEALVDSNGCRLLLALDNVSAPWTLVFEHLN